jgi:hypothetical protein
MVSLSIVRYPRSAPATQRRDLAIASLISITFDRYRSFASETNAEAAHIC